LSAYVSWSPAGHAKSVTGFERGRRQNAGGFAVPAIKTTRPQQVNLFSDGMIAHNMKVYEQDDSTERTQEELDSDVATFGYTPAPVKRLAGDSCAR
jgi:hypothetical protein